MRVRSKFSPGFTIVELLVVVGILAIVSVGILVFFRDTMKFNTSIQASLRSQNEARRILRPFANEVRGATRSALGAYPIELASSTALIFFTDLDEDGHSERIRYFLEGSTFKKGVIKPSGSPLSYQLDDEQIVAIVNDIVATTTPVFQYFNTNYVGASTTIPLVQPVSPALVRLVQVNLTVDKDPNQPPAAFSLTTQISFRNLKDNL
jgi:prepilin-type N-terminal cleavage/methylation domain-containing protein